MERYFLASVPSGYLSEEQILHTVRQHWVNENGSHWTLDTQFHEDEAPFCRKNEALLVLALLRAMARQSRFVANESQRNRMAATRRSCGVGKIVF